MSRTQIPETMDFITGRDVEVTDQVAISVKEKPLHKAGAVCLAAVGIFLGVNVSFGVPAPRVGEAIMLQDQSTIELEGIPKQRVPKSTERFSATHR